MGRKERRKGRKGESRAKNLLAEKDWTIIADTTAGNTAPDLIAKKDFVGTFAVEVKMTKAIDMDSIRKQSRANAKAVKLPYMIMAHIHGTKDWLVEIQDGGHVTDYMRKVWTEK